MEILRRYTGQRTYLDSSNNTVSARYQRVDKSLSSQVIKLTKPSTLDIISMQQYGTPLLFWLIADYNDILNPMIKLQTGTELNIPVIG